MEFVAILRVSNSSYIIFYYTSRFQNIVAFFYINTIWWAFFKIKNIIKKKQSGAVRTQLEILFYLAKQWLCVAPLSWMALISALSWGRLISAVLTLSPVLRGDTAHGKELPSS